MTRIGTGKEFVDLFAGIGGFRLAAESMEWSCVFSSEIDEACQRMYAANFGEVPFGDIRSIDATKVPDHHVLMAGFPCQPFSIIGKMNGLQDVRGTLYFEIERILRAKRPEWVLLENVKQLITNDRGRTLETILLSLRAMGYSVSWRVLNALDFGLPQKRERVFIVGNLSDFDFRWDLVRKLQMQPLDDILEDFVPSKYFASPEIQKKRRLKHVSKFKPGVWHENKGGNVSSYPFSCALRANASYNYLLVDGIRRLTPREMLRLQGFPDTYQVVCSDAQVRKQTGNAVAVPVVEAVLKVIEQMEEGESVGRAKTEGQQGVLAAVSA